MTIPRCQVIPESGHQTRFVMDGREVLSWHFPDTYPRPHFYPVVGPSGVSLTRMGHPGAPNHDHHQSLWFAHHKVLGISFWNNASPALIRQSQWFAYQDGEDSCQMAVNLQWLDGHDPRPLLDQQLICSVQPEAKTGEFTIELQSRFIPTSGDLEFQQTNFGFLALRVARSISAHFGGGLLTSSTGAQGERDIFGKPAEWMDYSGPSGTAGNEVTEGLTYFDHPTNPGQPTGWHVRDDGWMCASPCMQTPLITRKDDPLILRYLILVHAGAVDPRRNARVHSEFSQLPPFVLERAAEPHTAWRVTRED